MFNSIMFNQTPFNGVPGQQSVEPSIVLLDMLYVLDSTETLVAVLQKDSFSDPKHREVLNGENTFQFSFPAGASDAQYIAKGNLVGYKDTDVAWHFFEIMRIVDAHGDGLTRTAYCEHILYELLDDVVTDKRPSSSATSALAGMLENTRWQVGIVDNLGTSSTTAYYISALEAVQAVAEAWSGELQWRCILTGGTIQRYVDLRAARGTDTGKQFVYGKDIKAIRRTEDLSNVYTAVYGRGKGVETDSGAYGRRLTIEDEVWTTAGGDPVDKPAGQEWVGDVAALALWGRNGGTRHRYGIYTNEDQDDAAELLQETWDYLQANNTPSVTYELDAINLERLTGYSHEAVRLGDLVRVIDRSFSPELIVSARVVELERDLQDPAATNIVLGNFYPTIVETTINVQREVNEQKKRTYNTSWLDGKISVLQNEIENTSAYVFQTADDGILIMNAATFATATKAMKLGGGIFALANSKTGDAWNWRTFGDGAGFTADEINAGTIYASLVTIMASDNRVVLDDSGLKVYDESDNLMLHIGEYSTGQYGILVQNGSIYGSLFKTGSPTGTTGYCEISATGGGGYFKVVGSGGYISIKMDSVNSTGKISLYDDAGNEAGYLFVNPGSTQKELWVRSSIGGISINDGSNKITVGAVPSDTADGIRIGFLKGDLSPLVSNTGALGTAGNRWNSGYVSYLTHGDLCFGERTCAICGQELKPGDTLGLIVKEWNEAGGALTVPIHLTCKDTPATITLEVPEVATEYQLGDNGELVPYIVPAQEVAEIEVLRTSPDYYMDKATGEFFRAITDYNLQFYTYEELLAGVQVTKQHALCSDVISRPAPKTKTITFDVNGGATPQVSE